MLNIALTGSTGAVGSTAAHLLADAGLTARLIVRDASRAPDLPGFEVVAVPGDSGPPLVKALTGIDVAYMSSAHEGEERAVLHQDFVDVAVQAGVKHLVYLSFVGGTEDGVNVFARDHGTTESYLRDCGLDVTILRSNYYVETLPQFVHEGQIRGPAGEGAIAAVARADVAAAVAAVVADPAPHVGQVYELTGPDSLTFHDVAALVSRTSDESIVYTPQTYEQAVEQKEAYGAPADILEGWLSAYVAIREGVHGHVTDDVRHLLGRPPTTAEDALRRLQE